MLQDRRGSGRAPPNQFALPRLADTPQASAETSFKISLNVDSLPATWRRA
jgi:hypothetical protein